MQDKASYSKSAFTDEFDQDFYVKQMGLIDDDIRFFIENAQIDYETAEQDYKNERVLTVETSDGEKISLQMLNDERQMIKRVVGLLAGSDDTVKVEAVTPDDVPHSEYVQAFIDYEFKKTRLNKLKQALLKDVMMIGNGYIATYYDPRLVNAKYGSIGVITQENLSYDEVILDKNSRDNMDYEHSTFRNRETRLERLPLDEIKRMAKNSPYIDDSVKDSITGHEALQEQDVESDDAREEFGYIYTHEFRRKETVKYDEDGELINANANDEDSFDVWKYYYFRTINNSIDHILTPITESPINKFMIDVMQYEVLTDSPYSKGYVHDTKEERQLLAEAYTAETLAIKQSVKETVFITGNLTKQEAKYISDNLHRSMAHLLPRGSTVTTIGGHPVSPVFEQLIQRLKERKENKGGEYPLQAGKQSYSTETGKLANILNSRSDLSKVEDITNMEAVLGSSVSTFLLLAQKFYKMEVIIPRLSDDGAGEVEQYFTLNGGDDEFMLDKGEFDINIKIDLNSDVKKQQNAQLATANADILAPVDRLEMQGVEQPKAKMNNFYKSQGILGIAKFVNNTEGGLEIWEQFIAEQQAIAQLTENAQATLDTESVDRGIEAK